MIYDIYQAFADAGDPARKLAAEGEKMLAPWAAGAFSFSVRRLAAYYEQVTLSGFTHVRPPFNIQPIDTKAGPVPVIEERVHSADFCHLVRFTREGAGDEPSVLLLAPMSGHFATLLRGTIRTLLRDHTVYITDWINPRDIPLDKGSFGLDDYVQYIIDFTKFIGPRTHMVGVCQPTVPALAAVALMAQDNDPDQPSSLTLMAGPIDARVSPTKVNDLANDHSIEWFRDNLIGVVPAKLKGAGRKVYPGFLQLSAFISMNAERHAKSFRDLYKQRAAGEDAKADAIRDFYTEYFAIMDLTADFYLETVEKVFQQCTLARGAMMVRNRLVEPRAIKKTFLLTVEGEKDDICAVGQTLAAQDLCSGLRPYMKTHHMQAGVGHYGVFNGKKWDAQVYPVVRNHILSSV